MAKKKSTAAATLRSLYDDLSRDYRKRRAFVVALAAEIWPDLRRALLHDLLDATDIDYLLVTGDFKNGNDFPRELTAAENKAFSRMKKLVPSDAEAILDMTPDEWRDIAFQHGMHDFQTAALDLRFIQRLAVKLRTRVKATDPKGTPSKLPAPKGRPGRVADPNNQSRAAQANKLRKTVPPTRWKEIADQINNNPKLLNSKKKYTAESIRSLHKHFYSTKK